jgi:hypothetical protein
MSGVVEPTDQDYYEASARDRIAGLLDPGSFHEFLGPEQRAMSPHLAQFNLTGAFDDGLIVGAGLLDGKTVYIAAQEGRFMGGAFGEVHGAKLTGLLHAARDRAGRGCAPFFCFSTPVACGFRKPMLASWRSARPSMRSSRFAPLVCRFWRWWADARALSAAAASSSPFAAASSSPITVGSG